MHNLWCYVEKPSQRLRSDYDIREIDEDLYIAVLEDARQWQLGFSGKSAVLGWLRLCSHDKCLDPAICAFPTPIGGVFGFALSMYT